jgi:hypothetical protein
MAGPAELEMVAVGDDEGGGATVGVATIGVTDAEGFGFCWLEPPSMVPMTRPMMAAGTRSPTRTDRRPILVPDLCSLTNLL